MQGSDVAARLGVRYPIIQGPFGGGLSTAALVAAVANAGGLGSYGAHILAPDEIVHTAQAIRALTPQPFALNLWISNHDVGGLDVDDATWQAGLAQVAPYFQELDLPLPDRPARAAIGHAFDDQIDALLEARPAVFSFVFGIPPTRILEACRARGITTVGAATTWREAAALEAAAVDLIVVTGAEAGGHRPSFLDAPEDVLTGTFALTQVVARRAARGIVAAGGIVDGAGVRAAFALGAAGVQVGTAFLACDESGARDEHRALLFSERAQHTTLTRSFSGRLARGLVNRWTRDWQVRPVAPYPLQSFFTAALRQAVTATGAPAAEVSSLWSSQAAPNLRHRRAAAVMDELIAGLPA